VDWIVENGSQLDEWPDRNDPAQSDPS
jgi:hypothetical protein